MNCFSRRYSILLFALLVGLCSAAGAQERTTPVTVRNLLGIDPNNNTVKAEQSGLWSVKIDATDNTVKTPTQSSIIQIWTSNPSVPAGSTFPVGTFNCAGYRELRVVIKLVYANDLLNLKTFVAYQSPTGVATEVGNASFASPTTPLTSQANFTLSGGTCTFCIPVMSNSIRLWVSNESSMPATLDCQQSWVYLVN